MATERLVITEREIIRARKMAETGETPDGKVFIFTDTKFTGLGLRVQGKRASWVVKWKDVTVTIGYVHPVGDRTMTAPKTVRELAATVLSLMKEDGSKVKPFLDAHWSGQKKEDALKAVHKKADTWTLRECVEATIEGKTSAHAKAKITANTVKDYRGTFSRECFAKIMEKPAALITRGDIESVRDYVKKHIGTSPAIKIIAYTRAVLDYCAKNHAGQSGLDRVDPWWQFLNAPYAVQPRNRRPEVQDIVKTLILAEEYLTRPLPGRAVTKPGVNPGTLAGLWWLVLTCQRATAGMSLLAHDVVPDTQSEDFMVAAWAEDVMKAGQAHVLPIPIRAWQHINRFRDQGRHAGSQEWAFPSERKSDVHATSSGVYRILSRLGARDALEQPPKGKKPPVRTERRDLLTEAGIPWWSPHDLRRSLTATLDEHGIPGGATVILAHDIHEKEALAVGATERERENFVKLRTARITKMAYGGSQYISLKKEAMRIWCDVILDEYERQKAEKEQQQAA
ncbi:hypothetical protein [Gellertiella hungarica]|uniref:Uncharacterized protein n=1 Tax=Gellertiella hungarica TaxID=1572859 RepID=A0A7W6J516_9HYPH|nr:hypothetical protein [Gellertiella hungarica]MBB4064011.1 hypothetical protein [Gellertiella hungarica]